MSCIGLIATKQSQSMSFKIISAPTAPRTVATSLGFFDVSISRSIDEQRANKYLIMQFCQDSVQ